jgi:hypothetical protein
LKVVGWFVLALAVHTIVDPKGRDVFAWSVQALLIGWLGKWFLRAVLDERISIRWPWTGAETPAPEVLPALTGETRTPGEAVRAEVARLGGGTYLGLSRRGRWLLADPKHAVLVLGPPQSGKTTGGLIPMAMAASGALVSASTKPDVMEATLAARSEVGQAWLFDPSGTETVPDGVRRLSWSPVAAAATWDGALVVARDAYRGRHHQREPLVRARAGAAGAIAVRGKPDRPADRRGPQVGPDARRSPGGGGAW